MTDPVAAQLEAYNRHDADDFALCYAEDVVVGDLASREVRISGREMLRERYAAMFAENPSVHGKVLRREVFGEMTLDHEYVTGKGDPIEVMALYLVRDGLISKVWFTPRRPAS